MKQSIKRTILISVLLCVAGSIIALTLISKTAPHYWDRLEYKTHNITFEDGPSENNEDVNYEPNLQVIGNNSDTLHRIYIDSSGNTELPESDSKTNDYVIGKGKKNRWYRHLIHGLSMDVTQYAKSKEDFIKQYKAITFSYFYNYNFWNSWYGWTYKYGKNSPLVTGVESYPLTLENKEWLIFDESDSGHSNNERVNLVVEQRWNDNILSYNFYLGVCYYWKTGSIVEHAAVASFTSDEYTFTKISESEENLNVITDGISNVPSSFTLSRVSENIDFSNFDEEISRKGSDITNVKFKKTSTLVVGYFGSLQIDNRVYILSIMLRLNGLPNRNSNVLLNQNTTISRHMNTTYNDGSIEFIYKNSIGQEETYTSFADQDYLGIKMQGSFFLPFIYF